jgi:hypothetical protein
MLDPRMVQLIEDAYRRRLLETRPPDWLPIDESAMMHSMPLPPQWLVEKALAERMHLPEDERMRQVAELMVVKHLLPGQ